MFTCYLGIVRMVPTFTLRCPSLVSLLIEKKRFIPEFLLFPNPTLVSHFSPISPKLFLIAPEVFFFF